jgi:transposase InsO family protein
MGGQKESWPMPWTETCPMDQRVALIADWLRKDTTVTALAERYGVERKTVYKWVARYTADPEHGLAEQSRAPHGHGRAMAAAVRHAVLELRRRHPRWGPKKLRAVLADREPGRSWPAASTVGDLLRREGLSVPRRRTRYVVPRTQPLAAAQAPNDVWTADFKGWFRTADGTRCDPLTVADACTRFVFCCRIVPPSEQGVRPWFDRTFREYGLPQALRTDNGPPFASTGAGQLSHLAVWWLKLGIQLDRIDRGHPEQNGRHERFHLTLQQETTTPPAATPGRQQRTGCVRNSIRSGRTRRWGNNHRRACMCRRPGPTRPGWRTRGMTPPTRSVASSRRGRSSGRGIWCL